MKSYASPTVFACYCTIQGDRLVVGILALYEAFVPGTHKLFNLDDEQDSVSVIINLEPAPVLLFDQSLCLFRSEAFNQSNTQMSVESK